MTLRLSKQYGPAPALTFCRICGKDANEVALLGASCDKIMKQVYEATDGKYGDANGYQEYGHNHVPASVPCDECKKYLTDGGIIFIAKDTGEYLRLTKDMVDSLVGRVADAKGRVLDFEATRGKVWTLDKAFWTSDGTNIRLRDPAEWTE